jgi:hypothetical protein
LDAVCSSTRGGEVYIGGTTTLYEPIDIAAAYTEYGGNQLYQYNDLVPYVYDPSYQFSSSIGGVCVAGDGYRVSSGTYDTTRTVSYSVNGVYNKVGETDHYRPSHMSDMTHKADSISGYQVEHYTNLHRMSLKKDYIDVHYSDSHRSSSHGQFGSQNRDKAYHERDLGMTFDRYGSEERSLRFSGSHEHYNDHTSYDRTQEKVCSSVGNLYDSQRDYSKIRRHSSSSRDVAHHYTDRYLVKISRREREKSHHGSSDRSYKHGNYVHGHKRSRSSTKDSNKTYYGTDVSDSDEMAYHKHKSAELEEWVQNCGGYSRGETYHSSASVAGPRTIPVIQSRY